jgi:hypothetical protein
MPEPVANRKRRWLILGAIGVWGAIVLCIYIKGYQAMAGLIHAPASSAAPADSGEINTDLALTRPLQPLPDVDALARRIPYDQDGYQRVRDQALAAYAQLHPGIHSYDPEARETLKLACYLFVWNDYYGEGLWPLLASHAHRLELACADPVWNALYDIYFYQDWHSNNGGEIRRMNGTETALGLEPYPAGLRLWYCETVISNMLAARDDETDRAALGSSLDALPGMADAAVSFYRQIVPDHPSHVFLYRAGVSLLDAVSGDEPTLKQVSTGLDQAFAAEDRGNAQAQVLDGSFYTKDAWCARGYGYANTVTPEGWRLFADRLARANGILNGVYTQNPKEPGVATGMMTVVLGQEKPRDQMELWFQRGIQADGNVFEIYMDKRWYLLPRWYGTDQDVWNFGLECAQSDDWAAKIPMLLVEGIEDRAENDSDVFTQPEIWDPLEKVYREYLTRYPDSIHYRSLFARSAAQGGHWAVAKEQFKILGNRWDIELFPGHSYQEMLREVNAH